MDMRFTTEAEIAKAREESIACGYEFCSPEQALAYLEKATLTWRNPDWAKKDREEQIQAELNGMCEFYS